MSRLIQRIDELAARFDELNSLLSDPSVQSDANKAVELGREHHNVNEMLTNARSLVSIETQIEETKELIQAESDPDMIEMAKEELEELSATHAETQRVFEEYLLPPDPLDEKNIILEIRAGAGGEEAALFAADLLRMYLRYAEKLKWKTSLISQSQAEMGGLKEVVAEIKGQGVYSMLKYESGVHRVQRIPSTERQGRIHTSTVTVAVLPEAEDVDEVKINDKELRIDVYRSSGAGGQHVNVTDSAVRITHLPSGVVVSCQDERSQLQNRIRAMQVLRTKLLDHARQELMNERAADRKSQVGTGDRSERIRTYNFPQNRVTDHRINFSLRSLDTVIEGEVEEVIRALKDAERADRLAEQSTGSL
jgi:peptide chain release factor 1